MNYISYMRILVFIILILHIIILWISFLWLQGSSAGESDCYTSLKDWVETLGPMEKRALLSDFHMLAVSAHTCTSSDAPWSKILNDFLSVQYPYGKY